MKRLFGAYVVVDWSAGEGKKTGADSVWIGVMRRDVRFRLAYESHNPATRAEAEALLRTILSDHARRGERVLLGFDFCLGLPRGTAERLKLAGEPWAATWKFLGQNVVDKPDNTNNRFQVAAKINRMITDEPRPFWGAPARQAQRWLSTTKPAPLGDVPEFRLTEERTRKLGTKAMAKSVWQMHGAGAVGGQTLLGIAMVRRLVEGLGASAAVWPFGTGWRELTPADVEPLSVLVAEIYPPLFPTAAESGEVKDATQVRGVCEALAKLDDKGGLSALFAPPKDMGEEERAVVEREEGWILGS
ncbi:MAG TPA: cobalamin biosynthesis protein CbiG [Caulobacteraceae bacterium]|nr:cobalamin biosynthesis protein CbiG [Caulobacteraceae bacterium]